MGSQLAAVAWDAAGSWELNPGVRVEVAGPSHLSRPLLLTVSTSAKRLKRQLVLTHHVGNLASILTTTLST